MSDCRGRSTDGRGSGELPGEFFYGGAARLVEVLDASFESGDDRFEPVDMRFERGDVLFESLDLLGFDRRCSTEALGGVLLDNRAAEGEGAELVALAV